MRWFRKSVCLPESGWGARQDNKNSRSFLLKGFIVWLPTAQDEHVAVRRKAHTAHVRCLHCQKPVVTDRWAYASMQRPYHTECWEQHCGSAAGARAGPSVPYITWGGHYGTKVFLYNVILIFCNDQNRKLPFFTKGPLFAKVLQSYSCKKKCSYSR